MSKVPLHEYEKVVARRKMIKGIGTTLQALVGIAVVGGLLWILGAIVWGIWVAGYGIWVLAFGGAGGLLLWYLWVAMNDEEVLERARQEGTIDE